MKISALLLLTVAASASAAGLDDVGQGKWGIMEKVSPLDGSKRIAHAIMSTNTVTGAGGGQEVALLMVKCAENLVTVSVSWPSAYFQNREAFVEWRGLGEIENDRWIVQAGGRGAFAGGKQAERVLSDLASSEQFIVRPRSYSTAPDIIFDVGSGGKVAAEAVLAACPAQR